MNPYRHFYLQVASSKKTQPMLRFEWIVLFEHLEIEMSDKILIYNKFVNFFTMPNYFY